ncbi:MAG: OmpA family protein [Devosia sp.]
MRFRNWLLTGTSVTLLALAPITVARAQDASDPALVAAFQAYQASQDDATKQTLTEACIAAGFQSLDDCLTTMSSAPPPAPSSEAAPPPPPAPEPTPEAAPPAPAPEATPPAPAPEVTPAPAPEPAPEVAAPPAPESKIAPPPEASSEVATPPAPAPEVTPAPAPEVAAPPAPEASSAEPVVQPAAPDITADLTAAVKLYNTGVADIAAGKAKRGKAAIDKATGQIGKLCKAGGFTDTSTCLAQFGLTLDPVVEPTPAAPVTTPSSEQPVAVPSSQEAAPVASSQEAAPVASSQEAAPVASSQEAAPVASSQEAAPVSSEAPANNSLADLTAAVDLYNQGVTDLSAGDANGQAKIDQGKATIDKICADGGFADTDSCLAQFGLKLTPLPAQPGEPSASEVTTPSSEAPPSSSEVPISELPNASEAVTPSAVEVLPPTIAPSEAAPILDSAKDDQKQTDTGTPPSSSEPPAPTTPPAPPPTNDQQAQADITPPPADQQSTLTDKGKKTEVRTIKVRPPADNTEIKVIQPPPPKNNGNGNPPPPPQNNGVIFQIGVNIVISNPQQDRDRFYDPQEDQIYYEDLSRGRTRETITRPNGSKVVTVRNRNGDILQRSKVLPDGREIILSTYDPRDKDIDSWKDPGDNLPPLRLTIPADQYILDADSADDQEVTTFLDLPPVEQVRRIYTIDEVKRSARLRDSVRRLEVGGLTFDTGKATISRNQVGALSKVAAAMTKALSRNQGEVFLIEGHTDAVGSDVTNLILSDQRAATVARILTDFYDVPAENLVTQGYGERYLKVKTDLAEPINRRVTIKRITPLISYASN